MTVSPGFARYQAALDELEQKDRRRTLVPQSGVDFTSNDYLGLAQCERLRTALAKAIARGTPIGAGGSRLLRGNTEEHEALEAAATKFFGCERSLFFSSGYTANYAVLSTLPQAEDLILLDAWAHASANEGARSGRAKVLKANHSDLESFEDQLLEWRQRGGTGRVWIVVESLYSMDGDFAPLREFKELADRHGAMLYIDEAHATGVYGPDGRGLAAAWEGDENVMVLHTCSKALGGAGALVNINAVLQAFLINRCRSFIYATAPSPLMAVAALEALKILAQEPGRRERLQALTDCARHCASAHSIPMTSTSQILPIIVGDDHPAMVLATALQTRGFDVRGIRPPTVAEGTARLRLSITLNVTEGDIRGLFAALGELWQSSFRVRAP